MIFFMGIDFCHSVLFFLAALYKAHLLASDFYHFCGKVSCQCCHSLEEKVFSLLLRFFLSLCFLSFTVMYVNMIVFVFVFIKVHRASEKKGLCEFHLKALANSYAVKCTSGLILFHQFWKIFSW